MGVTRHNLVTPCKTGITVYLNNATLNRTNCKASVCRDPSHQTIAWCIYRDRDAQTVFLLILAMLLYFSCLIGAAKVVPAASTYFDQTIE